MTDGSQWRPPPPPRPANFDELSLGFTPRRPVAWLASENLAWFHRTSTGVGRTPTSTRPVQAAQSSGFFDHNEHGDLWVDYLAGTGDGFDATYTVAWAVAQRSLTVDGVDGPLPRGRVLIAGGDLVQPAASYDNYRDRFVGPFSAALPWTVRDHHMYALPGASDCADDLDNFRSLFLQERWLGGWRTRQSRSYFALRLPHRWWLWGLDLRDEPLIDDPQLDYFERVAEEMKPGDRVIMCVSPSFMVGEFAIGNIAKHVGYVEHSLIRPAGANVALYITGRDRFYARYQSDDSEESARSWVSCGNGGSYTSGTEHLRHRVLPHFVLSDFDDEHPAHLIAAYPSRRRSRRLSLMALMRVITANPGYAALLGGMHVALLLTLVGFPDDINGPAVALVASALVAVIAPGEFGSLSNMIHRATTFGMPMEGAAWSDRMITCLNLLVQVGLAWVGASIWRHTPFHDMAGWWPLVAAVGLYAPVAAVTGSVLSAATLLHSRLFGFHLEVFFAAAAVQDGKSFLRMHFSADGQLTVYALGIDRISEDWKVDPVQGSVAPDPEASWVIPARMDPLVRVVDLFTFPPAD